MSYIAKPSAHHPGAAAERARPDAPRLRRLDVDAVRRLRARLDHGRHHRGLLRDGPAGAPHRQGVGHRLLVEGADLLPRPQPRLQLGARPHAVGDDRRQHGQPRSRLHRRLRRRRHRLDRPRPVLPRRAPPAEHDLHRHEQRLLRPDQGPVLGHQRQDVAVEEGRGQSVRRHRPVPDGDPARRRLRRALVLRRQDAS